MPIDFFEADDGLHIRQSFESPTVYLDHWAIRLLTDDLQRQKRFIDALNEQCGTLLLSNFSLLEFSGPEDRRHCSDTEKFLDRVMPNIFFTDFAIDKTHIRESRETNNVKRFWPSADLPTLKYIAEYNRDSTEKFSMSGFLTMVHDNRMELIQLERETVSKVQEAFGNRRGDFEYVKKAKNVRPSDQRTRTFNILGELMRGFNLDPSLVIKDNDIIDLIHATAPLNCCDFILLDGPWEERVKKMNLRISKTSMIMPIAKCFSKRNNGVDTFISELESFDKEGRKIEAALP